MWPVYFHSLLLWVQTDSRLVKALNVSTESRLTKHLGTVCTHTHWAMTKTDQDNGAVLLQVNSTFAIKCWWVFLGPLFMLQIHLIILLESLKSAILISSSWHRIMSWMLIFMFYVACVYPILNHQPLDSKAPVGFFFSTWMLYGLPWSQHWVVT